MHVILGAYSGEFLDLDQPHNRRSLTDLVSGLTVSHHEYDKLNEKAWKKLFAWGGELSKKGTNSKNKITPAEAHALMKKFYSGNVLTGQDAKKMKAFNSAAKRLSGENYIPVSHQTVDELKEKGKKYATTDRGRKLMRAARYISIFSGVVTTINVAGNVSAASVPLARVAEALAAEDIGRARSALIGNRVGSLLEVLRAENIRGFHLSEPIFLNQVDLWLAKFDDEVQREKAEARKLGTLRDEHAGRVEQPPELEIGGVKVGVSEGGGTEPGSAPIVP